MKVDTVMEEDHDDDMEEEEEEPISPVDSTSTITSAPSARKPEYEFLLFNYLLRYVHREGRIGDFARAGILFLVDVAMGAPSGDLRRLADDFEEKNSMEHPGTDPIADAALALAEYIHDGDFAEVLGAGIVAVYSLLPSKLELRRDTPSESGGGMILGSNTLDSTSHGGQDEDLERARTFGLEVSSDPEFQSRLDHFLKMIEFLQDVLRRSVGQDDQISLSPSAVVGQAISTGILQAVKTIFLENVLYPSVLESSDVDGSAVAVLSYIDMALRTLPDGQLAELFINFLMSEDEVEVKRPALDSRRSRAQKEAKLRRRKSSAMMLLELETPVERRHSTYFASLGRFTLKDLVFSNLRTLSDMSHDAASTTVLQLLQTLLTLHPRLTVDKLLITNGPPEPPLLNPVELSTPASPASEEEFVYPGDKETQLPPRLSIDTTQLPVFRLPDTTFVTHEREIGLYLNLVSRIDPTYDRDVFSTSYNNYLSDTLESIKTQLDRATQGQNLSYILKYRLNPNDTLLSLLLQSLRTFFIHSVEYNVALTGALAAIASCPSRSLAGWMTFTSGSTVESIPPEGLGNSVEGDVDDRSLDDRISFLMTSDNGTTNGAQSAYPILHIILRGLVLQLDRYRSIVDGFDAFLNERRQGLMFTENLSDALSLSIELDQDSSFFSQLKNSLSPTSSKPSITSPGTSTPPRNKTIAMAASLVPSFLTPKRDRPSLLGTSGASSSSPSTEAAQATSKKDKSNIQVATSPFGPHYEKTGKISVQPLVAPVDDDEGMAAGWVPPNFDGVDDIEEAPEEEEEDEERNDFPPKWDSFKAAKNNESTVIKARVTLSQLLDNVVILEEFMKELSAIVQIRRSLGIDAVRYF